MDIKELVRKHLNLLSEEKEGWKESSNKLVKDYKFEDFDEAMNFVNQVAKIAEKQNHHPDIKIDYNRVNLSITDHEKGGVSEKCHKFVNAVNNIEKDRDKITRHGVQ
jgi:4a-hydroxytetrahydrobiopterin dehydratase